MNSDCLNIHWYTGEAFLSDAYDGFLCNGCPDDVVRQFVESAGDQIRTLAEIRLAFATSGAMRWPWSQEAKIVSHWSMQAV